jgi:hypothetical protein
MMTAIDELLALIDTPDPYALDHDEFASLRLLAANERFEQHRKAIRVLGKRAEDLGIDKLRSRHDLVPLMFSHTSYKTYPESFVRNKRWDRLSTWLDTVSAVSCRDVDMTGVGDVDEWVARLAAGGHHLMATSGTSGKNSFLNHTAGDIERVAFAGNRHLGFPNPPLKMDNSRVVVSCGSGDGPSRQAFGHKGKCKYFGLPGVEYHVTATPTLAELSEVATIRKSIADATASPSDVAEFENGARGRASRLTAAIEELATAVVRHRHEPMLFGGIWPYAWQIMEAGRRLGVAPGEFHPDTLIGISGGTKGMVLPDDYREQIFGWFAPSRTFAVYGMTEIATSLPMCEAKRYHLAPWMDLLLLDESGQDLLDDGGTNRSCVDTGGTATGRVAFYDPLYEGRWGAIVSGDKATVSYGRCPCGRHGPVVHDDIARYGAGSAGGDDKLVCASAVDAYIRSAIE